MTASYVPLYVAPVSSEDIASMVTGGISKKQYDALIAKVTDRANYVVRTAMIIMERKLDWWDYANEGGNEYSPGHFDPKDYSVEIDITGDFDGQNDDFYSNQIPTSWLSKDFEEELKGEYAVFKSQRNVKAQEAKQKAISEQEKKKALKASIRSKLTKEELQIITFKK